MAQGKSSGEGMTKGGRQNPGSSAGDQLRRGARQNLPDGAVTEAYRANREQILDLLNRALASEWTAFLQYEHHYTMASDIHNPGVREMWRDHADEELGHARTINERINQLGGVPVNDPQAITATSPIPFEAGHDLRTMLEADLVAERVAIQFYNEIVRTCGFDDNESRSTMEAILRDENEHANEISNLLYQFDASTGTLIPAVHQAALQGGPQQREVGG